MSGIFNELNIMDEDDFPSIPEDGTHTFVLRSVDMGVSTFDEKTYLKFNFTLDDKENSLHGYKFTKKFWIPQNEDDASTPPGNKDPRKEVNNYKKWIRSMGVDQENFANPDFESMTGLTYLIWGTGFDSQNGRMWSGNSIRQAQ